MLRAAQTACTNFMNAAEAYNRIHNELDGQSFFQLELGALHSLILEKVIKPFTDENQQSAATKSSKKPIKRPHVQRVNTPTSVILEKVIRPSTDQTRHGAATECSKRPVDHQDIPTFDLEITFNDETIHGAAAESSKKLVDCQDVQDIPTLDLCIPFTDQTRPDNAAESSKRPVEHQDVQDIPTLDLGITFTDQYKNDGTTESLKRAANSEQVADPLTFDLGIPLDDPIQLPENTFITPPATKNFSSPFDTTTTIPSFKEKVHDQTNTMDVSLPLVDSLLNGLNDSFDE